MGGSVIGGTNVTAEWTRGLVTTAQRLGIVAATVPRSVIGWLQSHQPYPGLRPPPAHRSLRQAGETGLDEFFLSANALVRPVPDVESLRRAMVRAERRRRPHWSAPPRPAPGSQGARATGDLHRLGLRDFLRTAELSFDLLLPPVLRARVPWTGSSPNHVAQALVLRHPGPPRSWVICIHGAGQGRRSDLVSFRARHLHQALGLNVALPVLPLHGPRTVRGVRVPDFDPTTNLAAILQATHDVRRLVTWISSAQRAPHIALYGVSLGGNVASVIAGVEPDVDSVIAGIPVTRLTRLLTHHLSGPAARGPDR